MKAVRFLIATSALVASFFLAASTVYAASQIGRGNIYLVKNETQNSAFTDPGNAGCNDTLRFRVHLHNIGPDPVVNARVKATLPSGNVTEFTSTVTITADNMQPTTVTDTASVNMSSSASVNYISGSTNMIDANGNLVANLPDGITQAGVVLPSNIGVSLDKSRFVQFKVKVSCPQPPQPAPKAAVKIRKVAEDASGKELSAVPTNTFTFKVTCDGQTNTVTYNSTPQAAGECTVGSTVTITEDAVSGWTIIGASTQTFTVTSDGLTAVFKNRQVAPPVVSGAVTPPPAQPAPAQLPVTGPASVIGLFAGASALAGIGHYIWSRRAL